jgi:hypothetical protein
MKLSSGHVGARLVCLAICVLTDMNGSVESITDPTDLIPKGLGFESRIGFSAGT